ncbi:MAG: VOC family protein [Acidobacteria bacterium]|nr:VOC family protein [Acidobacteriota bacterium]
MEHVIEKLVQDFERGGITRRQLIQGLAVAFTAATAAGTAQAAGESAFKAIRVNHISYRVADYAKTRDFYVDLLGMKVMHDDGKECSLVFGANDTVLIPRNWPSDTPRVDHIGYTIDHWNRDRVEAELKRRGLNPVPDSKNSFHVKDPNGFDVQICSKAMKP